MSGKVPVGVDNTDTDFDTVEKIGGEKTHRLTIEEMPRHTHGIKNLRRATWNYSGDASIPNDSSSEWTPQTQATGGDKEHNNIQPYITCYMWKRTA